MWDLIDELEYFPQNKDSIDTELAKVLPTLLNDDYADFVKIDDIEKLFTNSGSQYGFNFYTENDQTFVWSVKPGSEAYHNGITAGDQLLTIDGLPTCDLDKNKIKEILNTTQEIRLEALLSDGSLLNTTISKRSLYPSSISVQNLDEDTAHLAIHEFSDKTFNTFYSNLKRLEQMGVNNLVLDLRNNRGGSLDITKYMLDLFIDDNTLFTTIDKNGEEFDYIPTNKYDKFNFNLAIIIDRKTASASEIFSSSLRVNLGAVIIGEKSYGKGIVQNFIGYDEEYAVKLTTDEIYANDQSHYHGNGIEPDIPIESRPWITQGKDEALEAAIAFLKTKN